jgi:cysteine protease ATG4
MTLPVTWHLIGGLVGRWFDDSVNFVNSFSPLIVSPNGPPIYMIDGRRYSAETEDEALEQSNEFRAQLETIPWLTYRSGFSSLDPSVDITSDAGWGCTIRSSQMLIAYSLILAELGSGFVRTDNSELYPKIVSLFADDIRAPFSLHNVIEYSRKNNLIETVGEWFGPHKASAVLAGRKQIVEGIGLVHAGGGGRPFCATTIGQSLRKNQKGVIIIVSTTLSSDPSIDLSVHKSAILYLYKNIRFFRGLIGGDCVSQSYFFPAASEDYLYIMDPHTVQHAVPPRLSPRTINFMVPPQPSVRAMRWPRLGSSMAFGFFIKSHAELNELENLLRPVLSVLGISLI